MQRTTPQASRHRANFACQLAFSRAKWCLFGLILWAFALTQLFTPTAHAQTSSGLGIAAVVNDDVISMLDLNARISMVMESAQLEDTAESRMRIAPQVLRGLIDEKLKLQETRDSGVKVTQKDIELALKDIAEKNKMSIAQLTAHLQSIGAPISTLSARIETELAWNYYVQSRLAKKIQVGAEEIKDEINRIQTNAGKPEYLLAEIFLPVESPAQESNIRSMADGLLMQMRQGAPFSALAKNFSRAPSAALDGDMGWVQFSNLDPALQRVVTQLKPGNASPPVRTLGGYYIIYLRNVRTSPGLGGSDAAVKLSQFHIPTPKNSDAATLQGLAQQLVATTRNMTSCAQLEAAGAKSGSLMSGSLGEMKISSLPETMQKVLAELKVGQPSAPIPTGGGLAVLMICERTDDNVDMEKVRADIRERLIQSRLNVAEQRKLRDLHRDAFIDVRI
ncbi:peptidylprolyl isomerase [Magnetovibrio sp.]|uniref:peptidylprolyl isomerase n=1 Tax=Magnetovibrio sp. TaxID=2024836 RepID=UPI002F93D49F